MASHNDPPSVSSGTPTVDLDAIKAELEALATLDDPDEVMVFVDHCEVLIAEVERLRSALSALSGQTAPQAWQTIETAPKDGSQIHVAGRDWAAVGSWHVDRWYTHSAWHGARPLIDGKHSAYPTHWMPLPSPPSALSSVSTPENEGSEQTKNEKNDLSRLPGLCRFDGEQHAKFTDGDK